MVTTLPKYTGWAAKLEAEKEAKRVVRHFSQAALDRAPESFGELCAHADKCGFELVKTPSGAALRIKA